MTFRHSAPERNLFARAAGLTSAQYAAAGVGFLTALLAARVLGPQAFGVAAVVMGYPSVVASLTSVKSATVTQRYVSGFRSTRQHRELLAVCKLGFSLDLAISVLAVALVTGLVLAVDLPGTGNNDSLVALFALSLVPGSFLGTSIVVLFSFERLGLVATLQVLHKLIVLFAVATALALQANTSGFVVGSAVGHALGGLLYLSVASAVLVRAVGGYWWKASISSLQSVGRELRSLLSWNFFGVTLSGAMNQLPVLLLGALGAAADAGYFRLAATIAVTAGAVEAAMSRVAYSALAAAEAEGDTERADQLVVSWFRRESRLGVLAVVIAMVLLPPFIFVTLGDDYMEMIPGAEMLLIGTAASAAFFFVTPSLYSRGLIKKWVMSYWLYAISTLAVGILLIESGGFFAFAAAVGMGMALLNLALGLPLLHRARRLASSAAATAAKY